MTVSSLALTGDPGIRRPCAGFPGFGSGLSSVRVASMGAILRAVGPHATPRKSEGVGR